MRVRLLLDCSLGRRGAEVVVGPGDASRLLRKGRAVVVEPVVPVTVEARPEEVPEPEALVTEPADAEPPAGPEA